MNHVIIIRTIKSRQSKGAKRRALFQTSDEGFLPLDEMDLSPLRRHFETDEKVGNATYITPEGADYEAEELHLAPQSPGKKNLDIVGASPQTALFITSVLKRLFEGLSVGFSVRTLHGPRPGRDSDLAVSMGVLSASFNVPLPVTAIFLAGVDHEGNLTRLAGMSSRAERAFELGYQQVYGAMPLPHEVPNWVPCRTVIEVIEKIGFVIPEEHEVEHQDEEL